MPMRRESGRASGTGPPKKTKKIRKVAQNSKTSSLGSNAAAAHGYTPSKKPIPKQTRGQKQDLRQRSAPSEREKEFAYATRMRRTQPAEAKRQGDIVRTERKLKAKYDLSTGNYVRTNKRRFLPDEKVVIDPKTKKATTDITAATKQAGVQHAEVVAPALKVLEQTQRTVKATAGGARAAIRGEGPVGVLKAQKKGLLENKGPTWGKVLHEDLKVPKPAAAVAGFAADVATDPTTYVTGGSGKVAVKGAEKAAKDAAKKAAQSSAVKAAESTAPRKAAEAFQPKQSVREANRAKKAAEKGRERKQGLGAAESGGAEPLRQTVQRGASKKAVRQTGDKGTGIVVRFAGKELPGVRRGTAAVGRGVGKVVPTRARAGGRVVKRAAGAVRPQLTPEGMTKAEHTLNRQTERRMRAAKGRGLREAQATLEGLRKKHTQQEWDDINHAIETRTISKLPDNLRQPAIDIRSANRHEKRESIRAGVMEGDVTRRPATIVRHPSGSLKAGQKPTKRLTATVTRPKREPGAPKEYMPHMRASVIDGTAEASGKTGTRRIGSTMQRNIHAPVREANKRLGPDEQFSTDVPLVQANYKVQRANAKAGANMVREIAQRAPKVTPGRTTEIPKGHSVYRLHGSKLEKVDDAELAAMEKGTTVTRKGRVMGKDGKWKTVTREEHIPAPHGQKATKAGQLIHLNDRAVDDFQKQFVDSRTEFGKGFDFVQGKWKRAATFTPGFHIRNMIGDTQMAYLAQPGHRLPVNAAQASRVLTRATKREAVLRKTGVKAARTDKTIKINGEHVNIDDFLDDAINEGVVRSGMVARGIDDVASEGRIAKGELDPSVDASSQVSGKVAKSLRQTTATGKLGAPYRTAKRAGRSVNRGMQNREDLMRLATYKHGLDGGLTKPEAADLASAFHIDYGDVTQFERVGMRRAAPFYTFTARALPIHVKALVNTPGKIAAIEKARQELAYGMGLDDGWEGELPEWKQRAVPFGVKIKGEKVALDAALPVSMLNELPTSLDGKEYALEMWKLSTGLLTPIAKIPIEAGTGQSLFFRKPIKSEYTPYVSAPGWVKWLPENIRNGLGVVEKQDKRSGEMVPAWDPWTNWAFRQIPGLATQFQQITTPGALQSGRHDWQKVSGVLGVKADPIDPTTANITRLFDKRNKLAAEANKLRPLPGGAGGRSAKNPRVRALTKQLADLDYQIYQNSVERGDAVPQREGAIPNKKLLKPRVKQRGLLKKSDQKAAAKKSGGGSGWGGGASTGSGW